MGTGRLEKTEVIDAPITACWDALVDFESYERWQGSVKRCQVLDVIEEGRIYDVETTLDVKVTTVTYRLRYHLEPPGRIGWEFLGGELLSDAAGEYRLEEAPEGTRLTCETTVEVGRFVPGPIKRLLERSGADRFFSDVRAHLEPAA